MVPNKGASVVLEESTPQFKKLVAPHAEPREFKIVYHNLATFSFWHLSAIYGIYLCCTTAKWATILFAFFIYLIAEIGVTAGAHRLWAHKAFKAKLPLEILLIVMNSIAFQNSAFHWARDHRLHHKYSDTDADPHNATRGFFYSHIGWLLVKKHPEVVERGKHIPLDDLRNNPVLKFQKKYAIPFIGTCCFIMPTLVPVYFWGESLNAAHHINLLRYAINLNVTFLVNSAAHIFGNKPYDKDILSAQNLSVSLVTFGEGFHNYHHTFPYDYRAAELGNNRLNLTTKFIDFFAWIGWAYDLKTVSHESIVKRCAKTGDGTNSWGFGKKNSTSEKTCETDDCKADSAIDNSTRKCKCAPRIQHTLAIENCTRNCTRKHEPGMHAALAKSNVRFGLDRNGKLKQLKAYESTYPNGTIRHFRSKEVKLGDVKYHVFVLKLYNKWRMQYRAFCSGSIITERRVLTSAQCFYTNRKRLRHVLKSVRVAGGLIHTIQSFPSNEDEQQWRTPVKVYSQKFYRFPAYSLAIIKVDKPWNFNERVNKIPYAELDNDYNGVCIAAVARVTKSWAYDKYLFTDKYRLIPRKKCERKLLRSCRLYLCTMDDETIAAESAGGGLICYDTGDSNEDETEGLLAGVLVVINVGLPSLYMRVGLFNQWITDGSTHAQQSSVLVFSCIILCSLNKFV